MPDKIKKIRGNDPRLFHPNNLFRPRKGYRRIHRTSGIWEWKTNGYEVFIYSPKRERFVVHVYQLENMTREEWYESGFHYDWDDYGHSIYPSDVRDYIANHLEKRI